MTVDSLARLCMHIISEMSNVHVHTIEIKQDGHQMVCMFDQVLDQTTNKLLVKS